MLLLLVYQGLILELSTDKMEFQMTEAKNGVKKTNDQKQLEQKWGKETLELEGWTAIPNFLLDRQQKLGIDAVKLNILLVLLKHWWEKPNMPYPSKGTIAEIIGRDKSTVQRHIKEMEINGLIERKNRYQKSGGQTSNEYDLSSLLKELNQLARKEKKLRDKRKDEDGRNRRGYT